MLPFRYHQHRPSGTRRLKTYLLWAAIGVVVLAIGGIMALAWYTTDLHSVAYLQDTYQPSLITKVYADNGQVMGQFYEERRVVTPYEKIPRHVINAVIAVEDTRFFEHPGLDILGIVRAAWINIKRIMHGGRFQGASTITQQLARSLFLTPERTIQRKIRELILALRIEFFLEKKQILEIYLNQIYFGRGAYGVGTAASTYFGKELAELNLAESAFLAGLPKAPSAYSPDPNDTRWKKRQRHVLERMAQAGFISETLSRETAKVELSFRQHQPPEHIAPYFLEDVREHLVKMYGKAMVNKGGLQVSTTLNIPMQRLAEQAIRKGLRELDKRQGWRGPLRHENPPATRPEGPPATLPGSGEIFEGTVVEVSEKEATVVAQNVLGTIALEDMHWANTRSTEDASVTEATEIPLTSAAQVVRPGDVIEVSLKLQEGSRARFRLDQTPIVQGALIAIDPRNGAIRAMVGGYKFERSPFNRVRSTRQPGSAFKPMIYATAIRQGMTPDSVILDAPVVYPDPAAGNVWKPENYEKRFFGLITLREALRHSRNLATVHLLDQTGIHEVIDLSRSLGIQSLLRAVPALALGTSEVTLQELTSAYGVFGNNGLALKPYTIATIRGSDGQLLDHHLFEPRQVVSRKTAYLVTHMLMDVIQHGTGRGARSIGYALAGKTGTTNSYRDAWFVGYAPHLVAGVWVGFDNPKPLGTKEHGARAALPIWTDFMAGALKTLPPRTFPVPEDIQFAEADHTTGAFVGEPMSGSTTEGFAEGTTPQHPTRVTADPLDFYEQDQPVWDVTIQ